MSTIIYVTHLHSTREGVDQIDACTALGIRCIHRIAHTHDRAATVPSSGAQRPVLAVRGYIVQPYIVSFQPYICLPSEGIHIASGLLLSVMQ
jgi:hypothetical protein